MRNGRILDLQVVEGRAGRVELMELKMNCMEDVRERKKTQISRFEARATR